MTITYSQIKELKTLYKEYKKVSELISELKKTYQDRYGMNLVKLTRDGKEIELEENVLWTEIFHGGIETQAGKIMSEKYPELFENFKKQAVILDKLNLFTAKNWGFFFQQMSLVILIDLVLALIRYQLLRFFFLDKIIIGFKKLISKIYVRKAGKETKKNV